MANKLEFRKKLGGIVALGNEHNQVLSTEDVEKYFEEDQLSAEQVTLVYDYLLSQKIAVTGYEPTGGTVTASTENAPLPFTDEEQAYLKTYEDDLSAMNSYSDESLYNLYASAASGDAMAKSQLIEGYLPKVVEIGKEMHHSEIFIGDMIQEGNVGLMLAIDHLPDANQADKFIRESIRQSIQMMIEELSDVKSKDQNMVEKVQFLDESITKLTEEYGRKVSIEELAMYMELSEEEVMDILKLAGENLDEEEGNHTNE